MNIAMHLIVCPVLEDELRAVLPADEPVVIHKMAHGIHNDPGKMTSELQCAIQQAQAAGGHVGLLVGRDCESDVPIVEMAMACGARCPSEGKNCIELILGASRTRQLQANRTMLVTPGYVRMMMRALDEGRLDAVDARMEIGWFERILLLDTGVSPLSDEEILAFYDLAQVPVEIESVSLDHFRQVVADVLG